MTHLLRDKTGLPFDVFFIVEPIVNPAGKIYAVELLSRFYLTEEQGSLFYPAEFFLKNATLSDKRSLFVKQLEALSENAGFFSANGFLCTLNIDGDLAGIICSTLDIKNQLISMPFIRLEISETFAGLGSSPQLSQLSCLSRDFGLWLDDFGSGKANLAALQSCLFDTVKIDKIFFWNMCEKPLWEKILNEIRRYSPSVVVEGVESEKYRQGLGNLVEGMQGYLFPSLLLKDLPDLAKASFPKKRKRRIGSHHALKTRNSKS